MTKEQIIKEFDALVDTLPSRVGETPREVLRTFIERTYDTAYEEATKDAIQIIQRHAGVPPTNNPNT